MDLVMLPYTHGRADTQPSSAKVVRKKPDFLFFVVPTYCLNRHPSNHPREAADRRRFIGGNITASSNRQNAFGFSTASSMRPPTGMG
jgi:hypothetical protein